MPAVSATIITHNESANIARAIRSLSCADEIVVIDSNSDDDTCEVASSLGARVIRNPFEGFAAQKNFASAQAQHDWILSLDADEELNSDAQNAILKWKQSTPSAAGYRFARRAHYLGRWILHSGWYPDFKLRLFDRRQGEWKGAFVHESVAAKGPVETMSGEILHYTCNSLEEHVQRIEFYTDLASKEMFDRDERVSFARRALAPPWIFINTYLMKLGVLDGHQGYLIAKMAAHYVERKYAKLQDLQSSAHANR
jgi:glycosyltransferase involved in cell wall biosynthesis